MAVPVPDPVAPSDRCPICGKRRGTCVHLPATGSTRQLPPLPVVDPPAAPPLPIPGSVPWHPERCLLCGGRHSDRLILSGRRMLTVKQVAIHLNTSQRIVRRLIKDGDLKAQKYSPHSKKNTFVKEGDIVAFQDR